MRQFCEDEVIFPHLTSSKTKLFLFSCSIVPTFLNEQLGTTVSSVLIVKKLLYSH